MKITDAEKETIYRDYHTKVFGYLRARMNSVQDAEDLTADVFVKIFEKYETFDASKASLSTWIYTVTRNTLRDHFRTRKTYEEIPETMAAEGDSLEDEVCNAQMLQVLARALDKLEERERDVIILRYYSGVTLKEIAEKMGISYAYVKVLQNKALQKLRESF